jgi:ATP-binding cassette subfamily B multidrug efflux pump
MERREPPRSLSDRGPLPGPGRPPDAGPIGFGRPRNFRHTLSRLSGYIAKSRLLLSAIVLSLIVSSAAMLASSYFLKPLINNYILPRNFKGLAVALVVLGFIYILGIFASYLQSRLAVKVAQRTVAIIRRDLFSKMQDLELGYFDRHTHGELMSRYTNDIENVQLMLEQSLIQLISSVIIFVGSVVLMILLSPVLFLITAVVMGIMTFVSMQIGNRSRSHFMKQQNLLGELNGHIEESITGLREIKVFNHEEATKGEFYMLNERFRLSSSQANFLAGMVMPIMVNLNNISYAAVAVSGGMLTLMGSFDIGSLAAFLQYSRQIGQPISQVTGQFTNILAAMAGAERIFDVMDQEAEVDRGSASLVPAKKEGDGKLVEVPAKDGVAVWAWRRSGSDGLIPLTGDVCFEDVTFSYAPGKPVLKSVSLYAKPGQKIALVGSTGAGKTTVANLINRFYDVENGRITYDGIDVRDIKKESLRRSLGMVLQDTHLFRGTVLENIRYGRLEASDEQCIAAAKAASADSFISRLPQSYQTVIYADGGNLSQGQRQLIAIARAYAASPTVMILDEATSSIDTRTERLVQRGMDALMEGRTVFVIAHRLSTVRNADAILVIEHGEVIERGNHEDLLAQKGRYYQLYSGISELD